MYTQICKARTHTHTWLRCAQPVSRDSRRFVNVPRVMEASKLRSPGLVVLFPAVSLSEDQSPAKCEGILLNREACHGKGCVYRLPNSEHTHACKCAVLAGTCRVASMWPAALLGTSLSSKFSVSTTQFCLHCLCSVKKNLTVHILNLIFTQEVPRGTCKKNKSSQYDCGDRFMSLQCGQECCAACCCLPRYLVIF